VAGDASGVISAFTAYKHMWRIKLTDETDILQQTVVMVGRGLLSVIQSDFFVCCSYQYLLLLCAPSFTVGSRRIPAILEFAVCYLFLYWIILVWKQIIYLHATEVLLYISYKEDREF